MSRKTPAQHRAEIVGFARSLVGVHEQPPRSNSGPQVHEIQSSTGAYNQPWCVSTIQYIWEETLGSTWAGDTANAYALAEYARRHGATITHPLPGCAVVYHIGQGHAGTVTELRGVMFKAVEGNESDAVREVPRDPRHLACTFILRPELRDKT